MTKNLSNILKSYLSFYNKKLRKTHIIIYIIGLVIYGFLILSLIENIDGTSQLMNEIESTDNINIFREILTKRIPVIFLLVFSGITPYIFLPVMGIVFIPITLAMQLIDLSVANIILVTICSVIQIFGVSLAVSAGIYYCICSTKKFRHSQSISFSLDDLKQQYYEIKKDEKKLKSLKEKREKKLDKLRKLNVKIEYKYLLISAVISTIIAITASIVTGV